MKRVLPWIIVAVFAAGFIVSRLGEVTRQCPGHDHQEVREFIIRAALADVDRPIVVIGDSITEMARLPETIGDKPVVNAGIGGARIADFKVLAPALLQESRPSMIVVALGANNRGTAVQGEYADLLSKLKKIAPRVIAIGVTPLDGSDLLNAQIRAAADIEGVPFVEMPIPAGSIMRDRIHLNSAGYQTWVPAIVAAILRYREPVALDPNYAGVLRLEGNRLR